MDDGELTTTDVASFLNDNGWRYLEALALLRGLLQDYADSDEGKGVVYSVYSRGHKQRGKSEFKDAWQIKEKVRAKREDGDDRFGIQDVSDIIGITVVCNYRAQTSDVEKFLRAHEARGTLTFEARTKNEKGYVARHLDVELADPRYAGVRCEVQIKSVLHDAWTTWAHDLTYKPQGSLPDAIHVVMRYASKQLTDIDRLTNSFKKEITELWKRERQRRRACSLSLVQDVSDSLLATVERPDEYRTLVHDLMRNPVYRAGDCADAIESIRAFSGSYDGVTGWALTVLAARRERDDLDQLALDYINRWVMAPTTAESKVWSLSLKATALYIFNDLPAAIDASESALRSAQALDDESVAGCKANVAALLAEFGRGEKRARQLMEEVARFRGGEGKLLQHELDTLGLIKIVFGKKREIEAGKRLCQKALERDPTNKSAKAYCELHIVLADEKLDSRSR